MRRVVLSGAVAGAAFLLSTPAMADPAASSTSSSTESSSVSSSTAATSASTSAAASSTSSSSTSSVPAATTPPAPTKSTTPAPTKSTTSEVPPTDLPTDFPTDIPIVDAKIKVSPSTVAYGSAITVTGGCPAGTSDVLFAFSNDAEFSHGFALYDIPTSAAGAFSLKTTVQRTPEGDVNPRNGRVYVQSMCIPTDENAPFGLGETSFMLTGVGGSTSTKSPTDPSTGIASTPVGSISTPVVVETGTVAPANDNGNLLIGAGVVSVLAGGGILAMRKRLN